VPRLDGAAFGALDEIRVAAFSAVRDFLQEREDRTRHGVKLRLRQIHEARARVDPA
jgi:hypothetical protein